LRPLRLCVIFFPQHPMNELTHPIIGSAIEIYRSLSPGLLEAVYEECLAMEFRLRRIPFERQKPMALVCLDLKLECGYRLDFLVANKVVVLITAQKITLRHSGS